MSKYSLVLTIPFLPIAFNEAKTMDRNEFNELNKSWDKIIFLYSRGKFPPEPLKKVKLTLRRFSYRTLDYDGLVSSFKAPVDGLTECRIIKNDTFKITGIWDVDQCFIPKAQAPYITIQVDELDVETKPSRRVK